MPEVPSNAGPSRRRIVRDWRAELPFDSIVVDRVVGLYRNLADAIFPPRSSPEARQVVRRRLCEALVRAASSSAPLRLLKNPATTIRIGGPLGFDRPVMEWLPLPEPEFPPATPEAVGGAGASSNADASADPGPEVPAVAVLKRGQAIALLGGADHLSLFSLTSGPFAAQAKALASMASAVGKIEPFARSDEYGWLAADPDHAGAGIVLSFDVCLLGLCMARTLDQSLRALDRLGFDVYPAFGQYVEPTDSIDAPGCVYRIASVRNAGAEKDIVGRMDAVCRELARQEQNARLTLIRRDSPDMFDFLRRSLATAAWCTSMSHCEALEFAQITAFAVDCGFVKLSGEDSNFLRHIPMALSDEEVSRNIPEGHEARHVRAAVAAPVFRRVLRQFQA